jgi:hypothetical protein
MVSPLRASSKNTPIELDTLYTYSQLDPADDPQSCGFKKRWDGREMRWERVYYFTLRDSNIHLGLAFPAGPNDAAGVEFCNQLFDTVRNIYRFAINHSYELGVCEGCLLGKAWTALSLAARGKRISLWGYYSDQVANALSSGCFPGLCREGKGHRTLSYQRI